MKEYELVLNMAIKITLSDQELLYKYLIGEDAEFSHCYYDIKDIDMFIKQFSITCANLIGGVHYTGKDYFYVEGFSPFYTVDGFSYISFAEEYGTICVEDTSYGLYHANLVGEKIEDEAYLKVLSHG